MTFSALHRLARFIAPPVADPATAALYKACVEQARRPEFYRAFGVPDTVDGRFDLIVLHVFLVMRRIAGENRARQRLFDLMFADMDRSLREMGVGDMSIGKKMRPMIAAFYGRAQAYENALAGGEPALEETLVRNLYNGVAPADAARAMAAYVRRCAAALEGQAKQEMLSGRAEFATPLA